MVVEIIEYNYFFHFFRTIHNRKVGFMISHKVCYSRTE